jgi:cytochrome c553
VTGSPRRFPPPWTIEEHNRSCFIVRDNNATFGRRSVISLVASAVVAAFYQGSCYYFGNPQPEESPTPRRSSSDPLASGGPQLLEEDIASYSTGRPRSANSSSMALADRRRSERKWLGTDQSWIERLWGIMNAIARALSVQDSADVAAYFAGRADGLPPVAGEGIPQGGRSLRQSDPTIRIIFAGDPGRGIPLDPRTVHEPPCSACHGPGAHKLGAPALQGQHAAYIERQLAAFAQGSRQNDINEQMRAIAGELTPEEMHTLAVYTVRGYRTNDTK